MNKFKFKCKLLNNSKFKSKLFNKISNKYNKIKYKNF